jgi:prolyl-tRNA synthetase
VKLSKTFVKTSKTPVAGAETANHRLLIQAGMVRQEAAGIFSYLPLGLKVLRKIEAIVRQGMNELESEEILMPILHPKAPWVTTGGWDSIDVLFKLKSRTGHEYALGQSEEEIVTPLVLSGNLSYKDFPISVYQIHWKYRDELRAKSGILRGREFFMKDMYSFHATQADFDLYYQKVKDKYIELYGKMGLTAKVTEASGGNFSEKISYEFEVLTEAGEDNIYYCDQCDFCVEDEIAKDKPGDKCPRCAKGILKEAKASEVGNVFDLGQKYGKNFRLGYVDEHGKQQFPIIGCYGFGVSRTMGVIAEKYNDDRGLIWPQVVAPADIHLVCLGNDEATRRACDRLYDDLAAAGKDVIYDDRAASAGEKLADADLIGVPLRLVVSPKTMEQDGVEVKHRHEDKATMVKWQSAELSRLI